MTQTDGLPAGVYRFKVTEQFAGQRLDQFLADSSEQLSRSLARRLIDLGGVHLAGRRMRRCGQQVKPGQQVEVYVDGLALEIFQLGPQHILWQDRHLLVLNKPAGVATQPTPARYQGTLYAAILRLLADPQRPQQTPSLAMVQRLDRDTSGAIVFSIHPQAHKGLTQAFSEHRVRKVYWALVAGTLAEPEGEIRSLLARRRSTNRMVSVERGGKLAITRYRQLAQLGSATLVEVEIPTGRSHQIRVHFAELGHPLLGDCGYGGPGTLDGISLPRQMLHARELAFAHPVSAAPVSLVAPLADDFNQVLTQLGYQG